MLGDRGFGWSHKTKFKPGNNGHTLFMALGQHFLQPIGVIFGDSRIGFYTVFLSYLTGIKGMAAIPDSGIKGIKVMLGQSRDRGLGVGGGKENFTVNIG